MPDGSNSATIDGAADAGDLDFLRVIRTDGPLGAMRLKVRAIAEAEGFVLFRHGLLRPQVLTEREWRALPLAAGSNFDL